MGEWKEYKLSELIITNALTINKKYPYKEIQYLDTGSITCNKIESYQYYNIEDAPSRAKRLVKEEDIIYSLVRPNQLHYGFIKFPQNNLVVSTGFVTITCKKEIINPKFLYYYLTQNSVIEYLHTIAEASTSAYPSLKPADIENLDVEIPSLEEQKRIASILSSLDDKIDLLHQENTTLEMIAETLFNKTLSDKENDGTIEQFVTIQNGYAFKSEDFQENGINGVIKIKNISEGVIDINKTDCIDCNIVQGISSKFKVHTGDILIAMTGAEIGKLGIIPSTNKNLWLNQRVGMLVERYPGAKYIAYLQLKSDYGLDYVENAATGSAQPNISSSAIENCGFPLLDISEIKALAYQLDGLYEKIIHNLGQINGLKLLRKELLIKLMNNTNL